MVVLRTICRLVTANNSLGNAWLDKSLPSHEWPITGLPAPPNKPLTTHRSIDPSECVTAEHNLFVNVGQRRY
jgi:hypothetical protein